MALLKFFLSCRNKRATCLVSTKKSDKIKEQKYFCFVLPGNWSWRQIKIRVIVSKSSLDLILTKHDNPMPDKYTIMFLTRFWHVYQENKPMLPESPSSKSLLVPSLPPAIGHQISRKLNTLVCASNILVHLKYLNSE